MGDSPPPGFYRADGLAGYIGTADPSDQPQVRTSGVLPSPGAFMEELPESPQIEFGEQATFVHRYKMDDTDARIIANSYFRGAVIQDDSGFFYQVLSVNFNRQRGGYYEVSITSESISYNVPPDQFSVDPVEINPSIFYNPIYATVLNWTPTAAQTTAHAAPSGAAIIDAIRTAVGQNQFFTKQENIALLNATFIPDPAVLKLAQQLVVIMQQGADVFYLAGWKVSWSQFFYMPPSMNPGGYIEDPVTQGALPPYFWDHNGDQNAANSNILTTLAGQVNPTFYSGGLSWLRQADDVAFERTWFRITHSWVGGPLGKWQDTLYPQKVST